MSGGQTLLLFVLFVVASLLALEAAGAALRVFLSRRRRRARLRLHAAPVAEAHAFDAAGSLLRAGRGRRRHGAERLPSAALRRELRRAAVATTPLRFVGFCLALAALGFQGLLVLAPSALFASAGLALGVVPLVWLRSRSRSRTRRFEEQFPEALDLLIRALRAGHSLSAGIQLVGEELGDPIGGEFAQVAHEIRLGQPVKSALDHLTERIANPDVAFFATAVAVQQETGSNLVEVLANLAQVIRDRFQLIGKVRALTSLGRASANLLVVWPGVMVGVLWLVNADYVAPLWESPAGRSMVLLSAGLVGVGYVLCRRMAVIRV